MSFFRTERKKKRNESLRHRRTRTQTGGNRRRLNRRPFGKSDYRFVFYTFYLLPRERAMPSSEQRP